MTAGEFNNFPHITQDSFCYYQTTFIYNKNAFQDDHIPACIAGGGGYRLGVYLLGVYLLGGVPVGDVPAGGCTCSERVYLPWGWGMYLPGVYLPRGCVPASGGTCQCWYLPRYFPPVKRMTDRCKNIILPQTSFAGGKYYLT